jgi:hypothetical protein
MKASLERQAPGDVAQVNGKVHAEVVDADVGEEACDGRQAVGASSLISDREKKTRRQSDQNRICRKTIVLPP